MKRNNYKSETQNKASSKKKEKRKKISRNQAQSIVQIMNGDFLTKDFVLNNLNYIFFIIFLMILIVSKGYYVHQLANDITKEENSLSDVVADYMETKAELEEMTRRSEMVEKLAPLGLKETINPTKVIRIKDKKNEK